MNHTNSLQIELWLQTIGLLPKKELQLWILEFNIHVGDSGFKWIQNAY